MVISGPLSTIKERAELRLSSLTRDYSNKERKIINKAINGPGDVEKIVARCGTDTVQRGSMQTLKPGIWLNDEIIHQFYNLLPIRDKQLCMKHPTTRHRTYFGKSFFITKILNEYHPDKDGQYEYKNVASWSKNVPGEDIFNLDKIILPINIGNMHWIVAVIFMRKKRIEIFDSFGSDGIRYLHTLFRHIQDEHQDKKQTALPDINGWKLIPTQKKTPRQRNGTC